MDNDDNDIKKKFTELMDSPFIEDNSGTIYVKNHKFVNDPDKWVFYDNDPRFRTKNTINVKKNINGDEMENYLNDYKPYKFPSHHSVSQPSLRSSPHSLRSSPHSLTSSHQPKSETENKSRFRKFIESIDKFRPFNKDRRTKIREKIDEFIKSLLGPKGGFKTKRNKKKRSIRKKR